MTDPDRKPNEEDRKEEQPRKVASSELFRGERTLVITHSGEQYRLTITRNDKLILQK